MRIRLAVLALLLVVSGALLVSSALAQEPAPSLIIKVVPGIGAEGQADLVARNGGTITSSIGALRLLIVAVGTDDVAGILARYQADPAVQNAEINKVRVSEAIPTDALYANQWALPRIGWDQVFGVVNPTGSAKVALLDTGVDASHPELTGKVVAGTSILDGSDGLTDPSGHGTWLAGIIAARTNNALEGIAGVAYAGVQVMPVTVLNANGEGQDSDVIAGVMWAADHGADVILMAFSNPGFSPNLQDAIDYAWAKGAVIVASAGNNASSEPHFPAGDRGVMGVAATDQGDGLASFSNDGQAIFIAGPGVEIQTINPGGAYTAITGTSAAAAHVAGVAAFMKAVNRSLPNGVIVFRLASTADAAGMQSETGNGRLNMARALSSTAIDSIQPAGATPVGTGGPYVGPYLADSVSQANITSPTTASPITLTSLPATIAISFTYSTTATGATTGNITVAGINSINVTKTLTPGTDSDMITITIPSGTANDSYNVKLTVTNTTGTGANNKSDTQNNAIIVNTNAPPMIATNAVTVSVNEGQNATNSGTWSDPNGTDVVTLSASIGSVTKSGSNSAGTWSWSLGTTDGPAQSQTVTITANDGKGGVSTATFLLTVSNVPPSPAISGAPEHSPEGSAISLDSTVTDPSPTDTTAGFTRTWTVTKNGSAFASGTGTVLNFIPDDNGTYVVTLSATDKDGGVGSDTKTIRVDNVAPTVGITDAPTSSPEGTPIALGSSVTDPSSADTAAGFTRTWTVTKNGGAFVSGTGATFSFTPDDNGTYVVTLSATDKDGGVGSDTKTIRVDNVAPTAAITGAPTTSPEGTPIAVGSSVTDLSSADTAAGFTRTWTVTKNGGAFASGTGATFSFTPDDNGTYVVALYTTDKDGGVGSDVKTITVTNVNPTIAAVLGPSTPVAVNTNVSLRVSFTDPGTADIHTCAFDWDESLTAIEPSATADSCIGSHVYTAAGVYTVPVTVTDDDGGSSAPYNFEYIVVYDPSAGFVTGGGWIVSPAGAYRPNLTLTGKANFGFVSKYKKGATVPTGETEFQFHAAGLTFHSTTYEYLVISGAKAQYKGEGTVNGKSGYGFMLTATDGQIKGGGGIDKFRIKIWDKNITNETDSIVYDNMYDGTLTEDLEQNTQGIAGGSIVIQSGK